MAKEPAPPSVPMEEQPYPLPDNWCWVKIGSVIELISGRDVSPEDCNEEGKGIPYILGASNLNGNSFIMERWIENPAVESQRGDILLTVKGTIGKLYIQQEDRICISRQMMAIRPCAALYNRYAYDFLLFEEDTLRLSGHGLIPGISRKDVLSLALPLPPLPEQYRIVECLESLFTKLDGARDRAQAVLDGYEYRRAAILHRAFTGELTAQWRAQHGVSLEDWTTKPLSEITENHDYKRVPLSRKERKKLEKKYDYYGASGVIDKVDDYLFDGKYLLIGEDGANLVLRSKPIAFIAEGKYWVNNHAHVLTMRDGAVMEYLCYFINSITLLPYVTGSAQPKMTQAKMNTIPIPLPSLEEQREIVRILNLLIRSEEQTKTAAETILSTVGLMKKAILGRAFRGLLGTNHPAEISGKKRPPEPMDKSPGL